LDCYIDFGYIENPSNPVESNFKYIFSLKDFNGSDTDAAGMYLHYPDFFFEGVLLDNNNNNIDWNNE